MTIICLATIATIRSLQLYEWKNNKLALRLEHLDHSHIFVHLGRKTKVIQKVCLGFYNLNAAQVKNFLFFYENIKVFFAKLFQNQQKRHFPTE